MTQTVTTIWQSKRLLELGIDPHTADMVYNNENQRLYAVPYRLNTYPVEIPVWSLSALLELMPKTIGRFLIYDAELQIKWNAGAQLWTIEYDGNCGFYAGAPNLFTACIDFIEQLMKREYIKTNKE